jgi:hypothetical protein
VNNQSGIMGRAAAMLAAAAAFFGFKARGGQPDGPRAHGAGSTEGGTIARYQTRTIHWRRRHCAPMPGCPLRTSAFPAYPPADLVGAQNAQTRAVYAAQVKRKRKNAARAYFLTVPGGMSPYTRARVRMDQARAAHGAANERTIRMYAPAVTA